MVQDNIQPNTSKNDESLGSFFNEGSTSHVVHWKRNLAKHAYPFVLLLLDILLICVIFAIVVSLRYNTDLLQSMSRRILVVIIIASLSGLYLIGGYQYQKDKSSFRFISEHLIVSIGVFIGVFFLIYSFVAYGFEIRSGRSIVAATLIIFPALSILYRWVLSRVKKSFQRGNAICIIGYGEAARDLYRRLKLSKSALEVVVVDADPKNLGKSLDDSDSKAPCVESLGLLSLNSSMHNRYVESYVLACNIDRLPDPVVKSLALAQFSGNNISSYEAYLRQKLMIIPPSEVTMSWAMEEGFLLNKNLTYDRVKRLVDIMFGITGLLLISPVFLFAALLVKLTSPGPVIFKQTRVGKREVPFTLYKFRSMYVGSETGDKYTAKNDARLTPVGKLLRKTRLDELPQFWNVLKGDLSLIGPRAEWIELVRNYEKIFPYYHFRHAVKPGITGWAQVNYSYGASEEDTLEKLYYDLYYVRKHSLLLDAIIIVKTFYIMLFGRGQ